MIALPSRLAVVSWPAVTNAMSVSTSSSSDSGGLSPSRAAISAEDTSSPGRSRLPAIRSRRMSRRREKAVATCSGALPTLNTTSEQRATSSRVASSTTPDSSQITAIGSGWV